MWFIQMLRADEKKRDEGTDKSLNLGYRSF
jgi:hypothetical protein